MEEIREENRLISMNFSTFSEHKGNILQLMSCMEKSVAMGSMYGIFAYISHIKKKKNSQM